jgi:hypothetical protein
MIDGKCSGGTTSSRSGSEALEVSAAENCQASLLTHVVTSSTNEPSHGNADAAARDTPGWCGCACPAVYVAVVDAVVGHGLFAAAALPAGVFAGEYTGVVLEEGVSVTSTDDGYLMRCVSRRAALFVTRPSLSGCLAAVWAAM